MIFYVFELQTNDPGAALVSTFSDLHEAESKFYLILSAAAISTVRRHGAMIVTEEGVVLRQEVFTHKVEEPVVEDPATEENGAEE